LDFDAIRREMEIPSAFPRDVLDAADRAATSPASNSARIDATHLPLVTMDPPGSRDLDQAVALERDGDGWLVHYAIADVAAWIMPASALDDEARRRTQTYYAPDHHTPLHPPRLSESAASLLPDGPRPAVLWSIGVDGDGDTTSIDVRRATVRSRAQLSYGEVQQLIDQGRPPQPLEPIAALGQVLLRAARARGAIELGLPEQDVVQGADGRWTVSLRADLPVEHWNAEISLLTGRAAARLMLDAGTGILRTVPTPDPATFPRLAAAARNLGIEWRDGDRPGAVLAALDTAQPRHAAFADLAAELLRGAAYTAFDGTPPTDPGHAGVGAPYAHVTAPLRRLVDRFGTEVCLAIAAGQSVPPWAAGALGELPDQMAGGDNLARRFERAVIDATEAFVLADRVGDVFSGYVVETGDRYGTVVLDDPPVRARCDTRHLPLGQPVHVRCTEADVGTRTVRFERVS